MPRNLTALSLPASVKLFALAGITLLLFACGGGGGGGSATPATVVFDPTGYYDNVGTLPALNITDLQAMIYNNRFIMASKAKGYYYDGPIAVSGNTMTGNLTQFQAPGAKIDTATLNATINPDQSITGTVVHARNSTSEPFTLHYAAGRSNAAVPAITTPAPRNWTGMLYFNSGTLTIRLVDNNAGAATLTTVTQIPILDNGQFGGCDFAGTIKPITGTSLYDVSFIASGASCASNTLGGPYTGFATVRSQINPNDTLVVTAYFQNSALRYSALFGEFQ